MGSFCSCLQVEYFEDYGGPLASFYRDCICLRCFTQQIVHAYTALFQVNGVQADSQVETTALSPNDDSACDTYRSPPRPLAYDDPRFFRQQRHDRPFARGGKSSSNIQDQEESEPLSADNDIVVESQVLVDKRNKTNYDCKLKKSLSGHELKLPSRDSSNDFSYFFTSSEDEDVCPTCLEEYTSENPRIVMQCSHHFHLGCIYEWMERSDACPVCGKMMVFSETS